MSTWRYWRITAALLSQWVASLSPALAGIQVSGRVFDGEESLKAVTESMRKGQTYNAGLKVPLAGKEIRLDLVEDLNEDSLNPTSRGKSWKATTDSTGSFSLDTGLEKLSDRSYLVVRAEMEGVQFYSSFLKPGKEAVDVHVYPSTESWQQLGVKVSLAFDIFGSGNEKKIRVRFGLRLANQGGAMYVGKKSAQGSREIWRIPLPKDAEILVNTGPYKGVAGWKRSSDGAALVLDTPIPGVFDSMQQEESFEVHYVVPARQTYAQSFELPIDLEPRSFVVWCPHEVMSLSSAQLTGTHSGVLKDPFSGEDRSQDVVFSTEPLRAGMLATVLVKSDNVALGQTLSTGAVKWVGGFILVCVLSLLLGMALGPKEPSSDALLKSLSGEEILDRIAQLDVRRSKGEIGQKEYQLLREPLMELAAEESLSSPSTPSRAAGPAGGSTLPDETRAILQRIDELEKDGLKDPAKISERAHLLEALAKVLRREGGPG